MNWKRIAFRLVAATLAYNVVEAGVGLWAAWRAHSIALAGFGLDSLIECLASAAVLWHLWAEARGAREAAVRSLEHRVHRFVGFTFLLLAAYVTVQAGWTLWHRYAPQESVVGIVLAAVSLLLMPALALFKLSAAREVGSRALRAEARETLACSYLSFTLLAGLAANAALGWWWADPVAALLMVPFLIGEGMEGLGEGEGCCD